MHFVDVFPQVALLDEGLVTFIALDAAFAAFDFITFSVLYFWNIVVRTRLLFCLRSAFFRVIIERSIADERFRTMGAFEALEVILNVLVPFGFRGEFLVANIADDLQMLGRSCSCWKY